ncbi:AAA family ATPase [Patescibacteria group bacterium]|nr:AAA family ATPase [Patescibacteria group bacterium]MBU1889891.1 AAA family ATPase [Patescibacteria group bacterium]
MSKKTRRIIFVSGVSGTGKSSIVKYLKMLLGSGYTVFDLDSRGVPTEVDSKWRQRETRHFIKQACTIVKKNITTIVCGHTRPEEIFQMRKSMRDLLPKFCLLDASQKVIAKRLKLRFNTPTKKRQLRRITGESVQDNIRNNIEYAKKMRKYYRNNNYKIFNTSISTPEKSANRVSKWILTKTK